MPYNYEHGSGTEQDPYQIWTPEDLDGVRDYLDACFIQMDNIDMSGWGEFIPIAYDTWTWEDGFFKGKYNGNNKEIQNIWITGNGYVGLFAMSGQGSEFKNIIFLNPIVTSTGGDVGALIGFAWRDEGYDGILIENCHIKTSVQGSSTIGAPPQYSGASSIGALLGYAENTTIIKCSVDSGTLVYSTGTRGHYVGGIVGSLDIGSLIEECFSFGQVEGVDYVGGIVGCAMGAIIKNCYSKQEIRANNRGGGICGFTQYDECLIENCYYVGLIINTGSGTLFGNILGDDATSPATSVINSYYNMDVSTINDNGYGTPKTTEEMVYPYSDPENVYENWDFNTIWAHDKRGQE